MAEAPVETSGPGSGTLDADGLALLAGCLAFSGDAASISALRRRLFDGGLEAAFRVAGQCRLLAVLAEELQRKALVPPIPSATRPGGLLTATAAIERSLAEHREQRRLLAERLSEVVAALNRRGIEPILIKGARSLWTGSPSWRSLRDIDLLVANEQAETAQATLRDMGYAPLSGARSRPRHHHLTPLFRHDLPGWLEIHRRGGNHYAEQLLPTAELAAAAIVAATSGRGTARLLSKPHHVLHALIHHHAGHSAFARQRLDIKGLYEFAFDLGQLAAADRAALAGRASAHPRLAAMLDLWIAAAADLFALVVPEPFTVHDDAMARWRRIRDRLTGTPARWKLPGYASEIAMASATARLKRQPGGQHMLGRQMKRLAILASLLPRSAW